MPKNLAENMASERPICECGHGPTFHHNPIGYCEHTCACSDYRPAPAATTPERDAMPLSEAIEELRIRANQERYLERRRQRDGQDNTGARVVRAIDTVLAALTPRDDPAAATTPDAAGDAMECLDCGHEAHGISCPARTEMSNGEKDICLCDAGWKAWVESKSKSIGGENGQD
jgi:hypothetical protein